MFGKSCALIGAVHLPPMPGAAGYCGSVNAIVESALKEASIYKEQGFDALVVENTHDAPYLKGHVYPETITAMTVITKTLKDELELPMGIQVLAGANMEALAIANALELDFIRVEGFVYAHIGDEGIHDACCAELVRKRFDLKAEKIKIYADVKKKHSSHSITADTDIVETAKAAVMFQADGVVVSGIATGASPILSEVKAVKEGVGVDVPVLIGSGINPSNIKTFSQYADGLIIGSYVKKDGRWQNNIEVDRCKNLIESAHSI